MKNEAFDFEGMFEKMCKELDEAVPVAENARELATQSVGIVHRYLAEIKDFVLQNGFDSPAEEINFFKQLKPKFYSRLIYFHKMLESELNRPTSGRKAEIKYLHREQTKLNYFFKRYIYLYRYRRSGSDFLDIRFFTRGHLELLPGLESYGVDTDPAFTTGYDFILAKMEANEMFRHYLEAELANLQRHKEVRQQHATSAHLSWTASKASMIELLYALQSTGVFNNGQAAISEIALFLEEVFQIKLGNYYRVFQEIRIRKKSRTQFLDEMKDRLIQKMDYADENPQFK